MRLIDADKLLEPGYTDMFDTPIRFTMLSRYAIESAPTVKAIPIEWIEKWINSKTKIWVNPKYADTVFTDVPVDYYENFTPYQVIAMLEDWEKENETNRQR